MALKDYNDVIIELKGYEQRFVASQASAQQQKELARLSIIVASGWIEECIDDLVLVSVNATCTNSYLKENLKKKVNFVYGFETDKHVLTLILLVVGAKRVNKYLSNPRHWVKFDKLKAALDYLSPYRNRAAHTYDGYLSNFIAPSVIISKIVDIRIGLNSLKSLLP